MTWKAPKGHTTPCRLYVGGNLIATIKKKGSGRTPFYFHQKNDIIKYNGGFGSVKTAKRHAERKLKAFARMALAIPEKYSLRFLPGDQAYLKSDPWNYASVTIDSIGIFEEGESYVYYIKDSDWPYTDEESDDLLTVEEYENLYTSPKN